ncbi:MAG: tetratricopeptide repeat protein [Phycisphaerales bacterium]|nr:tetratricopeptide repeat protein [Phycisphaerales bacterium]NNM27535.1 tetratricopeptide repeat protein [Phycisphaerales bacterium]
MNDSGKRTCDRVTRTTAARLLQATRHGDHEAARAAFTVRPTSRCARRVMIETLLAVDDVPAADRLTVEGLLLHPTDPALSCLRAECLRRQRRPREARRELRPALRQRPHHAGTALLAARLDRAAGDLPSAVRRLETLAVQRPDDESVLSLLAAVLLEGGAVHRARSIIDRLGETRVILQARLARAEGRGADAIEILEAGHRTATGAAADRILTELLRVLEPTGDSPRLTRWLRLVGPDHPRALLRAGSIWLRRGAFGRVIADLKGLRSSRQFGPPAVAAMAVAAVMAGRRRLAQRLLDRLDRRPGPVDAATMSELWRRALTADALVTTPRWTTLPKGSVLPGLLAAAVTTFEQERGAGADAASSRHRATCLAALGRRRELQAWIAASTPDPTVRSAGPPRLAA